MTSLEKFYKQIEIAGKTIHKKAYNNDLSENNDNKRKDLNRFIDSCIDSLKSDFPAELKGLFSPELLRKVEIIPSDFLGSKLSNATAQT